MNKLVTLLCASTLAIAADASPVAAQDPSDAMLAESVVNCMIQSVAAFPNRVHIHCMANSPWTGALSSGAVRFFATENSVATNAMALTALSVANASIQRIRPVTITYRNNPNENPAGCNPSDCRRIVGVVLN